MSPHYEAEQVTVWHGDCIDVMRSLPDASVDAVVTDPPYGLEFMGREWDSFKVDRRQPGGANHAAMHAFQAWCEQWATEVLRVLKPGGHLLAFGGTRTFHRLTAGIEDAGFEIRDSIAWLYGSGFPKSLDVSKAIDRMDANEERTIRARTFQAWLREHMTPQQVNDLTGTDMGHHLTTHPTQPAVATADLFDRLRPHLPPVPTHIEQLVADRTVESKNFAARKVTGYREMVDTTASRLGFAGATYGGTGATRTVAETAAHTADAARWQGWGTALKPAFEPVVVARKPLTGTVAANVLTWGTGALNIDASRIAPTDPDAYAAKGASVVGLDSNRNGTAYGEWTGKREDSTSQLGRWPANVILDGSQAFDEARYFYTAKASTDERPSVDGIAHPTVKPLDLMRWLVRLVTPPGGTVLEPFAGSGTTVEACLREGFRCIAIEREETYLPLVMQRVRKPHEVSLFGDWEDAS